MEKTKKQQSAIRFFIHQPKPRAKFLTMKYPDKVEAEDFDPLVIRSRILPIDIDPNAYYDEAQLDDILNVIRAHKPQWVQQGKPNYKQTAKVCATVVLTDQFSVPLLIHRLESIQGKPSDGYCVSHWIPYKFDKYMRPTDYHQTDPMYVSPVKDFPQILNQWKGLLAQPPSTKMFQAALTTFRLNLHEYHLSAYAIGRLSNNSQIEQIAIKLGIDKEDLEGYTKSANYQDSLIYLCQNKPDVRRALKRFFDRKSANQQLPQEAIAERLGIDLKAAFQCCEAFS